MPHLFFVIICVCIYSIFVEIHSEAAKVPSVTENGRG